MALSSLLRAAAVESPPVSPSAEEAVTVIHSNRPTATALDVQPVQTPELDLLREDLRLMREQLEQTRREAAAEREAERLSSRLREVETALAARSLKDAEAVQASNRFVVVAAAVVAGGGLLVVVALAWFQWRVFARFAIPPNSPWPVLANPTIPEQLTFTPSAVAERSNFKLANALTQLEQRLGDLERAATQSNPGSSASSPASPNPLPGAPNPKTNGSVPSRNGENDTLQVLLARGQAFLNAEQLNEALVTFEQILSVHPKHAQTLVKRGLALERLGRTNEALASYDLAIAADPAFTAAYLHKGGLFNKLERYAEALQCYETALRLKERRTG